MKTKKHRGKGGVPFTIRERSIIEIRWCQDNKDVDDIANELNRHRSSVYREIQGKPRKGMGKYDADRIQGEALDRIAKRGNVSKIKKNVILCNYIEEKMKIGWTPEQIHLRLPIDYPKDKTMCIATESIYQEVYRRVHRQGNGAIKKGETDLRPLLVRRHKRRMKKGFRKARRIERNAVLPSIDTRPKVIEKRKQLGHWEDDCIVSRQSTGRIKSINERVSGVGLFGKMINGTIEESNRVVIERLSQLPIETRQTLTRDRGTENMGWKEIEDKLTLSCYFAHPYSSYERGSNENLNGLVRRFFPKKTDLANITDEELSRVEYLLNNRPRKRHGGLTPLEVFFNHTGVAINY